MSFNRVIKLSTKERAFLKKKKQEYHTNNGQNEGILRAFIANSRDNQWNLSRITSFEHYDALKNWLSLVILTKKRLQKIGKYKLLKYMARCYESWFNMLYLAHIHCSLAGVEANMIAERNKKCLYL